MEYSFNFTSSNVKLNGYSIIRLLNAEYQLLRPFLLLIWFKYPNKSIAEHHIAIYYNHKFSNEKCYEKFISEQINTKCPLLSAYSFSICHMAKIGQ